MSVSKVLKILKKKDFEYCLDQAPSPDVSHLQIVEGWIYAEDAEVCLRLELNNQFLANIPCNVVRRDVYKIQKHQNALNSGFKFFFPGYCLNQLDSNELKLIARSQNSEKQIWSWENTANPKTSKTNASERLFKHFENYRTKLSTLDIRQRKEIDEFSLIYNSNFNLEQLDFSKIKKILRNDPAIETLMPVLIDQKYGVTGPSAVDFEDLSAFFAKNTNPLIQSNKLSPCFITKTKSLENRRFFSSTFYDLRQIITYHSNSESAEYFNPEDKKSILNFIRENQEYKNIKKVQPKIISIVDRDHNKTSTKPEDLVYLSNNKNSLVTYINGKASIDLGDFEELISTDKLEKLSPSSANTLETAYFLSKIFNTKVDFASINPPKTLNLEPSRNLSVIIPVQNDINKLSISLRTLIPILEVDDEIILVDYGNDSFTKNWLFRLEQEVPKIKLLSNRQQLKNDNHSYIYGASKALTQNDLLLLKTEGTLDQKDLTSLKKNNALVSFASQKAENRFINEYQGPIYIKNAALKHFGFLDQAFNSLSGSLFDYSLRINLTNEDCLGVTVAGNNQQTRSSKSSKSDLELLEKRWGNYLKLIEKHPDKENKVFELEQTADIPTTNIEALVENCSKKASPHSIKILSNSEVVFIVPCVVLAGGILSVLQHANEMSLRGIKTKVISLTKPEIKDFPLLCEVSQMSIEQIFNLDWTNQRVISTLWLTSFIAKELFVKHEGLKAFYYIQDYEPWFYKNKKQIDEARKSYHLGLQGVCKTKYLKELLKEKEDIEIEQITPGIDSLVFHPGAQDEYLGPPRISAYYRPSTPRRAAQKTIEFMLRLKELMPEIEINIFGELLEAIDSQYLEIKQHGSIPPSEVASLYKNSDLVIDLSKWHGFGRMGIEAMASGSVPILSNSGGVGSYAEDEINALILEDPLSQEGLSRTLELLKDKERRMKLRNEGIKKAKKFSEFKATDDWLRILNIETREASEFGIERDLLR